MIKWERATGLNSRAKEIIEKFTAYRNIKDDSLREVLKYYIETKLKINIDTLEQYEDENALYRDLIADKNNLITEKEQLESTIDFTREILDLELLNLEAKTNSRNQTLILYKEIGLTKQDCKNLFLDFNNYSDWNSFICDTSITFVENFVNKYMKKNVNLFLATVSSSEKLKIDTSKLITTDNKVYFNLEFKIKVDDLDDAILEEVGKIVSVMPKFA